jgi:hypothetical protein
MFRLIAVDQEVVWQLLEINSQRPGTPFLLEPEDEDGGGGEHESFGEESPLAALLRQLDLKAEDLEGLLAGNIRFVGVYPRGSHHAASIGGDRDVEQEDEEEQGDEVGCSSTKRRLSKAERKKLKKAGGVIDSRVSGTLDNTSSKVTDISASKEAKKSSRRIDASAVLTPSLRMVIILELSMVESPDDGEFVLQCRVVTPADRARSYLETFILLNPC